MKTEAKVGAFVLVCAAILLITIYRVSSAQIRGARVSYKTYLRYAGGLEPGADVLFGGITVGAVTAVRPDAQDPTRIEILMDVKLGTPVNARCVARLGSVTLVTNPVISISTGANDAPRLPPGSVIPPEETISVDDEERKIAALADSAHTLMDALQTDVKDAHTLIAHLNEVTDKPNQQRLANVLANADAMVARTSPKIDQISDQLVKLTNEANGVMAKMGPAVDNINATASNANQTISSLREPTQADLVEVRKTLAELQAQMRAKDQDITSALENVRMITDNLNELTESVKERPWSLVRIREPKDRKVPPVAGAK
ncbi:MAG TPA: MlaD family protein [Candidatus Binatia bacterium]|nr:MlaD family protein [Candidatus Binatia bacterium]